MTPFEVLFIVVQLIFLEGILSIDNAAVLGAMVSVLPANEPIPWPKQLSGFKGWGDRVLGGQRAAALKVGLLGAYAGRALMLLLAAYVIQNPWLRLLGAFYLFKISIAHLGSSHHGDEGDASGLDSAGLQEKSFWGVVVSVELADLAFSLDNVVAAVALSSHLWVVMLGVALGIVTMRFAAQVFTVLIEREPVLVVAAYLLVLNISVQLMVADITYFLGHEIHIQPIQKFIASILIILATVGYARTPWAQEILGPFLRFCARILGAINAFFDLLLRPFAWVFHTLVAGVRALLRLVRGDKAQATS
ncbi:MAG: hypothetical protein J5I90_06355 [Caldilineales bacterium]|nr:hypothetical protein [Caldilineales bacterium]